MFKFLQQVHLYRFRDVSRKLYILGALLWALALLVVMGGCSILQSNVGPTAKKVADYYCAQPLEARLIARAEIAKAIAPATLTLVCPGDDTSTP